MLTILNTLDVNSRLAPSIDPKIPDKAPNEYSVARVAKAVMPLFVLIPTFAIALQVIAGGTSCYKAYTDMKTHEQIEKIKKIAVFAFHATSIGLLYVNPLAVTVLQSSVNALQSTIKLGNHILKREYKVAFYVGLNIADKCVFIGAVIVGGPQVVLISMIAQVVYEAYKLNKFRIKEMHLETLVQIIVLIARGHGIYKHVERNELVLSHSYEKIKSMISEIPRKYSKIIPETLSNPFLNVITFVTYDVSINTTNGFSFHVANYSDGTRVVTCLNGDLKGLQGVAVYGIHTSSSTNVAWNHDHFVHKHPGGRVYSWSNRQIIEID